MNKKFLVYWKQRNHDDIFTEEIEVPDNQDPEKFIEGIYKEFNDTEDERAKITADDLDTGIRSVMDDEEKKNYKYIPHYRDLILIYDLGVIVKEKEYCTSSKVNVITLKNGGDLYRCSRCGLHRIRMGFGEFNEKECFPDRTCGECNKVFETPELYEKHKARGKHKQPAWVRNR